jgi:hypothetical protein
MRLARRYLTTPQTSENILAAHFAAPEFCGRRNPRKFEGARNAGKPKAPRSLCTQRVTGVHRE